MTCERWIEEDVEAIDGTPMRRCTRPGTHDVRDRRGAVYSMCEEHAAEALRDGAEEERDAAS